ncbi:MAG: histidine--tRNA ligase [Candidatus Woesearchaeota archaeon]|jgi:histidyl-tRNA synthetase|nr:histidine--tRNA ligase [Candidatus Woesearchaeota archaeon]
MTLETQSKSEKDFSVAQKKNFEILKGTKDSSPKEQIKINKVLEIIKQGFESFGFRPFDTPLIEYLDTLKYKYDEDAEIVQEIFKLSDRGERELGLRYDLTVPMCRFVAQEYKKLKKPFRRYQIGKVFRDGPIKAGRMREFMQCDGDVVGINGVEIEAEALIMFYETYEKLGIDGILELNNNKILRGALLQSGFEEKDLSAIILSIDKLKKIGEKGVLEEIKKKSLDDEKAKLAIDILSNNSFEEIKKVSKNDLLIEGIEELEKLTILIKSYTNFRINFSMSRGLDIYTGNIWEAYEKNGKIKSSIGSGGRYDKVIGDYVGNSEVIPALGVSFGLVPIMICLEKNDDKEGLTDTLIVPLDKSLVEKSFDLANKLRKNENVEMFYGYKLKKAFDYAEYLGCENLVILGKNDIEEGVYTLKNLSSGKEEKVKF